MIYKEDYEMDMEMLVEFDTVGCEMRTGRVFVIYEPGIGKKGYEMRDPVDAIEIAGIDFEKEFSYLDKDDIFMDDTINVPKLISLLTDNHKSLIESLPGGEDLANYLEESHYSYDTSYLSFVGALQEHIEEYLNEALPDKDSYFLDNLFALGAFPILTTTVDMINGGAIAILSKKELDSEIRDMLSYIG